jgi:hypothetical protein
MLTKKSRAETDKVLNEKGRPRRTLKACFLRGSNSTCRGHIARHHFEEYKSQCNAATPRIEINFRCMPKVVQEQESEKKQSSLSFPKSKAPTEFTREGILDGVVKFIACDDQVSQPELGSPTHSDSITFFRLCPWQIRSRSATAWCSCDQGP